MTLSNEQREQLLTLTRYPEYKVLQLILNVQVDELKDVTTIDLKGDVAAEALGRKFACEAISNFLSSIGLLTQEKTIKDNTYE